MPTPAEIALDQQKSEAGRLLHWLDNLEHSEGFIKYLGPKIFAAYDAAQTRIIDAHATGKEPAAVDIATLQGFHEIVTTWRRDQRTAWNTFNAPPPAKSPTRQA